MGTVLCFIGAIGFSTLLMEDRMSLEFASRRYFPLFKSFLIEKDTQSDLFEPLFVHVIYSKVHTIIWGQPNNLYGGICMNFAAHELLETSEALRTKAAEIEQHGMFANQCNDQRLKGILEKHQQQMMSAYQQGINLAQGRGAQLTHQTPNFQTQNNYQSQGSNQNNQSNATMQHQSTMSAPMMNPQTLSDQTMATLALNTHKTGSMMGMQWANECVDTLLRTYHVNGANLCQEMAYEIWTWMHQNGYYQPTTFNTSQTHQMKDMFQNMGSGSMNQMQGNQNQNQHQNHQNQNPMQ
ncbi:hypothetical protein CR203_20875 [Salipaludibacillus neizhouensis]|uniref:Spore coat protein n=1 Tax=Salipaludibacillus neizhouensis TaxID=885475 RepID=A0A3A9JWX6_9BACI|nr:spore coat protein [Salipaludibacillus neizhouensis]RKL65404.1 hypothetical protein CR203_20875 [Salipaludibacillus neizhouensis]